MTKRLLSIALALLMVLALVPMGALAKASSVRAESAWVPVDEIEANVEYLIGFVVGSDVYLIMNYNPSPITSSNNYYYSSSSNYYGYTAKADLNGANITGCSGWTTELSNCTWKFTTQGNYGWTIQSAASTSYYLSVYNSTNYTDLCPYINNSSYPHANWNYDASAHELTYRLNSYNTTVKYASYLATAGSYSNFCYAPTTKTASNSYVQLYKYQEVTGPTTTEVTYTGETVEVTNPKVNDTFDWTFSVSEASALSAGTWYIDYDENYLTAIAFDYSWEGGLSAQIGDSLDPQSDVFMMSYNLADVVNGNTKLKCMLNLTSFDFNGINDAGKLAKITFKWNAVPTASTSLAMPIEVVNSYCGITASGVQHSPINTVPGAVNVTISSAEDVAVTYTGDKLEITDPAVNDTFDWTFSVSDASSLSAGTWVIDYDENYFAATAFDYSWEGGIAAAIGGAYEPTSDEFMMSSNLNDNGTVKCVLNLLSFGYNGINEGGKLAKITFKFIAVPEETTTIPMPIQAVNSYCGITSTGVQHNPINVENGEVKVIINTVEPTPEPTAEPTPEPTVEPTTPPEVPSVTITGDTMDRKGDAVGTAFFWYLNISEDSDMYAGQWLVKYDPTYLTATAASGTWNGGLASQINSTWTSGSPTSDKIAVTINKAYTGLGDGNTYLYIGLGLSPDNTHLFYGLKAGGQMARVTFKWVAIPEISVLSHDSEGYYMPLPITNVMSSYVVNDNGNYATADYPEANVTLVDGKIYIGEEPVQTYTVIFKDWDGTELKTETVEAGQAATEPADPTRTGYTFTGWDVDFTNVQSDLVVTAQYTINTYTITFVNYDGDTLQTVTVDYNQTPAYTGETPVKPGDAQYTYTFTGWDPQIVPATANATYTAQFEATVNKYNIMFVNYDGTVLQQGMVAYGGTPAYNGETPAKPAEGTTTYNFIGWDPQIAPVTGEATYTAQFEAVEPTGYHIYVTDYTTGKATTSIVAEQLYSGDVTFTVTCDIACAVAIDNGDGTYTRLTCTTENGEHKFTVTVNADVNIIIVIKGDTNLNGKVETVDSTLVKRAVAGLTPLSGNNAAIKMLAADVNGNGQLQTVDSTLILRAVAGLYTMPW